MKNTTIFQAITLILFCLPIAGKAQVKGTIGIGPDISFTSSKSEIAGLELEIKNTDFSIGLSFGYYIIDNLEIGLGLSYISSTEEVSNFETNSTGLALGPQIVYKVPLSSQFYIPIGASLAYTSTNVENDLGDELTYNGLAYGLFTGVEFISNNKLGVHLAIGPQFGTLKDADSDDEFDLTLISANLGFSFYF